VSGWTGFENLPLTLGRTSASFFRTTYLMVFASPLLLARFFSRYRRTLSFRTSGEYATEPVSWEQRAAMSGEVTGEAATEARRGVAGVVGVEGVEAGAGEEGAAEDIWKRARTTRLVSEETCGRGGGEEGAEVTEESLVMVGRGCGVVGGYDRRWRC